MAGGLRVAGYTSHGGVPRRGPACSTASRAVGDPDVRRATCAKPRAVQRLLVAGRNGRTVQSDRPRRKKWWYRVAVPASCGSLAPVVTMKCAHHGEFVATRIRVGTVPSKCRETLKGDCPIQTTATSIRDSPFSGAPRHLEGTVPVTRSMPMGIVNDHDPVETQEWLDSLRAVVQYAGPGARALPARAAARRGAARRCACRRSCADHAVPQHDPARARGAVARQSRARAQDPLGRSAGTRWRWSCARTRNPPSSAATSRASSPRRRCTTSASTTSGTRRPTTTAATCIYFQGHSSPGIYARAFLEGRLTEGAAAQLPPGESTARASRRIRIRG